MNQKIKHGATAQIHPYNEKVIFSKEEVLILSNTIKKSKALSPGTKAMIGGAAAFHR